MKEFVLDIVWMCVFAYVFYLTDSFILFIGFIQFLYERSSMCQLNNANYIGPSPEKYQTRITQNRTCTNQITKINCLGRATSIKSAKITHK